MTELTNDPEPWDFSPFRRFRLIGRIDIASNANLDI